MNRTLPFVIASLLLAPVSQAQDDLLSQLEEEEAGPEYSSAAFKTTRVINGHSLENTGFGVLDFRINHRFGTVNGGGYELWGLDGPTYIRLGFDYGLTDRLAIGVGRSNYQKTYDGFVKYKFLKQCEQGCTMPISLAVVAATSMTSLKAEEVPWYTPEGTDYFSNRLSYAFTVIVGRKFSERVSLQLNPGLVHRNLVATTEDPNDVFHVSGAGRVKVSKRVAVNAEYFYVLRDQLPEEYTNSLSLGLDIETGGHVFQLHFTNSTGMFERAYITETTGTWADGDVHFGFNISRVFTVHEPKRPKS